MGVYIPSTDDRDNVVVGVVTKLMATATLDEGTRVWFILNLTVVEKPSS